MAQEIANADEVLEFFQLVQDGAGQLTSAFAVGWTPNKLKKLLADESFRQMMMEAVTQQVETVEEKLFDLARRGNMRAVEMFLYNRSPDRWSPPTQRVKVESTRRIQVEIVESAVEAARQLIREPGAIAALQQGAIETTATDDD